MDLVEVGLVDPRTHWYYRAKYRAIRHFVQASAGHASCLVDVGAGSGFFSQQLVRDGLVTSAICVDTNYGPEQLGAHESITYVNDCDESDLTLTDVVILLDVLEHVTDDRHLLAQYVKRVPQGTRFVVTVPAFKFLWSGHDIALDHKRRYTRKQLVAAATDAGLQVAYSGYLFGLLLPLVAVKRKLERRSQPHSDLRPIGTMLNRILGRLFSWENVRIRNKVGGLSVILVGISGGKPVE